MLVFCETYKKKKKVKMMHDFHKVDKNKQITFFLSWKMQLVCNQYVDIDGMQAKNVVWYAGETDTVMCVSLQ